ncbi:unnamed protein product [Sphagnum jensenii]|uniref:Uncharacterized protein n=1 Tax=Sphagnum jensenii TaxID=128206 RepID=A0ABP1BJB7_9BRYO
MLPHFACMAIKLLPHKDIKLASILNELFMNKPIVFHSSLSERGEEERRRRTVGPLSVQAKGRRSPIPGRKPQPMPSLPKVDDDGNPKFVLFIRTKNVPRWYPLSIVTGGTTAKVMVAAMGNEWGKKFYQGTLTRNIAGVIYKDERAVKQAALKQYPVLKAATGFEYGYKIMDTKNPKAALFGSDVIQVPPQEELKSVVDKVKDFFGNTVEGVKESFGSLSTLPSGSQEGAEKKTDSKGPK